MREAVREFDCRRCGRRTCVCRPCDRGQEYCGEDCAELSRQAYLRVARARYQKTRRGAHLHAARQRRYRSRRRNKKMVTDHSSAAALAAGTVVADEITAAPARPDAPVRTPAVVGAKRCDFCGAIFPDPDPGLSGGGARAASTDLTLRAAAQTQPPRGTGAVGLVIRDRPAAAGGGDRRDSEVHPDRRVQARAGLKAPGARHGARHELAGGGGRSAAARAELAPRQPGAAARTRSIKPGCSRSCRSGTSGRSRSWHGASRGANPG